jgi:hypothetical protein
MVIEASLRNTGVDIFHYKDFAPWTRGLRMRVPTGVAGPGLGRFCLGREQRLFEASGNTQQWQRRECKGGYNNPKHCSRLTQRHSFPSKPMVSAQCHWLTSIAGVTWPWCKGRRWNTWATPAGRISGVLLPFLFMIKDGIRESTDYGTFWPGDQRSKTQGHKPHCHLLSWEAFCLEQFPLLSEPQGCLEETKHE